MRNVYRLMMILCCMALSEVRGQGGQAGKKMVTRNGKTAAVYTVKNGQPDGDFIQYYPNGLMQAQGINSPYKKSGEQYWYFPNNTLRKTVEYTFSYSQKGHFRNCTFHEIVTEYWENGKNKFVKNYLNGKQQFEYTEWYNNGNLKRENKWDAEKKHHLYTEYFDNGQKKSIRPFLPDDKTNLQDGQYKEWNEKGILIHEANYVNGKPEGYSRSWANNGTMTEEVLYANNDIMARKTWTDEGKLILAYDKRDPANAIDYVGFYPDKKTIRDIRYAKSYTIDDTIVKIVFAEQYNEKGVLTQKNVFFKQTVVACWFDKHYAVPNTGGEYRRDTFRVSSAGNMAFDANLERRRDGTYYALRLKYNPVYNEKFFSQGVSFPVAASPHEREKMIRKQLGDLKKKFTHPGKVNPDYLISKAQFDQVVGYFTTVANNLFYSSLVMQQQFDSTRTGPFSMVYVGSRMRYEGHLKEGLLDGTCTLYMNDTVKLSEKEYHYGLQHGRSREWHPNGALADETYYSKNRKTEETLYFINGGKYLNMKFDTNNRIIAKEEWYYGGQPKIRMEVIHPPEWKYYEMTNEWYKDGSIKQFSIWKDSVLKVGMLFNDGQLKGYNYSDFKRQVFISKTKEKERQYLSVKIADTALAAFNFEIQKDKIRIKGKAWRQKPSTDWHLDDQLGTLTQVDFSQLRFSETLPCDCHDWEEHNFFRMALDNYTSESAFLKYQLNFHQPLQLYKFIGGNPYYQGDEPEHYIPGKTYDFSSSFVSMKEVVIPLPDTNGILFSLSPCISQYAFAAFHVYGSFRYGFPGQTQLTIMELKTLSLTFNSKLLRQVDENGKALKSQKGQDLPGMLLFQAKKVTYEAKRELDVIEPKTGCSRPMEVTGTGMIIDVEGMLPDVSRTYNYPEMNTAWHLGSSFTDARIGALQIPMEKMKAFRGAFLTSSTVKIPYNSQGSNTQLQFRGEDLAIGSDFVIGTLSISARKSGAGYTLKDTQDKEFRISDAGLKSALTTMGLKQMYLQYDPETAELKIHFYYTLP